MQFNGIDQHQLLSALSPLTRNMYREICKRRALAKHKASLAPAKLIPVTSTDQLTVKQ